MSTDKITFFRPQERLIEEKTLPAIPYNNMRLLFNRIENDCQFIPIRTMQFQAVITENEVIFIDSFNYAVNKDQGGRMIVLAWQFPQNEQRTDLTAPVQMNVIHYHEESEQFERRLFGEFLQAMNQVLERQFESSHPNPNFVVVEIK